MSNTEAMMTDLSTLWRFEIRRGNSDDPRNGACTMDAVSYMKYGRLGDHPECACPILTAFVIRGQDAMPDAVRQRLMRPRIPYLIDSRDPEAEAARLRCIVVETARRIVPATLDVAGGRREAETLRALPEGASYTRVWAALEAAARTTNHRVIAFNASLCAGGAARAAVRAADWASVADVAAKEAASAACAACEAVRFRAGNAASEERVWDVWASILDEALALGKTGELDIEAARQRVKEFEAARAGAT